MQINLLSMVMHIEKHMKIHLFKVDKHQQFINNIIKYIKQVDMHLDKYYI